MEENPYENQVEFALRYGELDELPGKKSYRRLISIAAVATVAIVGILSLFLVIRANNKIIISFNTNGGSAVNDIEIDKGSSFDLPTTTRSGYEFEGWYRNGTKISSDITFNENVTLTARWIIEGAETFTISFDSNGGSKVESVKMECGTKLVLPDNPTRQGYSFVVWSDKNDMPILDGAQLACEDTKLIASWTKGAASDDGPEKITLNHQTVDLTVGDSSLLVATIEPEDAKNKIIAWTSSDPEIVSVDASGMITAHRVGDAVITAASPNGKSATAVVYSDVDSVTIRATSQLEYISNYGDLDVQKSVSFTVSTFPSIDLLDSDFHWEGTNTSGITAVAELESNGASATLKAKNMGGSDVVPVKIKVSVGRTSSKEITIYVEPELVLSGEKSITTGNELTIISSTDVAEWGVRAKEGATRMTIESVNRTDRKITVKPILNSEDPNTHQAILSSDLAITATTRAGQRFEFTATCVKN